ncbi:MAG: hypothetical protein ACKVT2_03290 [Saprospiraceae bacterium]
MKRKFLVSSAAILALSLAAYFAACKKDNAPDPDDALVKPISVSFSRAEILGLLANAGANEVAGICFMPVQDGDRINLQAILAEWNTSENKPKEMVKVMDKTLTGKMTADPCPPLLAGGTTEFELVYYDKATLLRFLDEDHYYPGATQLPEGIYLSRVMLDLGGGSEYKKYRGLVLKPYPLPDLSNGFTEREGLGYQIGAPCPPIWHE